MISANGVNLFNFSIDFCVLIRTVQDAGRILLSGKKALDGVRAQASYACMGTICKIILLDSIHRPSVFN